MKNRNLGLAVLLILSVSLVLGGCATTFSTTNGKLAYGDIKGQSKGTFQKQVQNLSIFSPFILPLDKNNEKLDTIIEPELKALNANAATNVEIKAGFDLMGFLITSFTAGVLQWGMISVSGTAIQM